MSFFFGALIWPELSLDHSQQVLMIEYSVYEIYRLIFFLLAVKGAHPSGHQSSPLW